MFTVNGYFMLIDASYKVDGSKAILSSPTYHKNSDRGSLTFWYYMWGADMGTLNVTLIKPTGTQTIFSLSGNQGNMWKNVTVGLDLSGADTFHVAFTGLVSHSKGSLKEVLGDIAIDDVSVYVGDYTTPTTSTIPAASTTLSTTTLASDKTYITNNASTSQTTVNNKSTVNATGSSAIPQSITEPVQGKYFIK